MDPFSVAASIGTIVALITKSISTLNSLRIQCQDAQLRLELLAGQLETVQAALRQVNLFVTDCLLLSDQHHQLVADVARAVGYCKLLVQHIDHQISRIHTPGCDLKLENRVLLVLEDKAIEEYLTRLDHQLSALNVCLVAFNCRNPREQKKLLAKSESRTIFEQAADDANSLVQVDQSSLPGLNRRASVMSTQSQLSKIFTFDEQLLRHKIYQRSFRYMVRRASTPISNDRTPRSASPTSMTALELRDSCERSARLDSMLKADAAKQRDQLKILCLGHRRSTLVKQLRNHSGPLFQAEDLHRCRRSIVECLVRVLVQIADDVEMHGAGFSTCQAKEHVRILREYLTMASSPDWDWEISCEVSAAARGLWRNWLVQQNFRHTIQDCATTYFLESTDRILNPDYRPNTTDIIRAPESLTTVKETRLSVDELIVNLIEIPHTRLARVLHQFEEVDACLLSLDLASYDQYFEEYQSRNNLDQGLRFCKDICRSFPTKPIILILTNFKIFREKLKKSPLGIHFPDFKGKDATAAADYILRRFKRGILTRDQELYHHFAQDDAEDQSTVNFVEEKLASLPGREIMVRVLGLQSSTAIKATDDSRFRSRLLSAHSI